MKKQNIFFLVSLFLLLTVIVVLTSLYAGKIKKNPPDAIGNTAGNLNNDGLFCESNGKVYFSNLYDNGTLYSMNPDETQIKKISNAEVTYINAAGNYLYYYQSHSNDSSSFSTLFRINGLYRSRKNSRKTVCLNRVPTMIIQLVGNTLYYQHYDIKTNTTLHSINTDKTNPKAISDYVINPACASNGIIYFNGTKKDHYLYQLDTRTNEISTVWTGNIWQPQIEGNYIYYMDVPHNYRLCRYSLQDQSTEVLTEDRIDFFNVYKDIIYYQKSSATEPALKRMRLDGSNNELVANGVFRQINITSQYVYFTPYGKNKLLYHTPTHGSIKVSTFDAARRAVTSMK